MARDFNMNDLKGAAKLLNEKVLGDGEQLRIVGVKKEVLLEQFATAIETASEAGKDIPVKAVEFFNFVFDPDAPEEPPKGLNPDKNKAKGPAKTEKKKKEPAPKSCFGHKMNTQAAFLDDLFAEGTTLEEAAETVGVKRARVVNHMNHLIKDRGLKKVELADNKIRIE